MRPDVPVKGVDDDRLDFKTLATALKESICDGDTPLTVGVYGDWGSGKTSLLKMVQEQLAISKEDQKIEPVWFSAWEHQGADNLIEPLMAAILRQAPAFDKLRAEVNKVTKVAVRAAWALFVHRLSKGVLKAKDIRRLREEYKIPMDEIAHLRGEFEKLVVRAVGRDGRLVVFIDDLDRCMPDTALALMEAMKLFFWVKGCVYVVGVARDIITSSVKAYFVDKGFQATKFPFNPSEYLEKIFEFTVNVPKPREKMKSYIDGMLTKEDVIGTDKGKVTELIKCLAAENPRRAKRFVNSISLMQNMWCAEERVKEEFSSLIAATCLAARSQTQFRNRDTDANLLDEFKSFLEEMFTCKEVSCLQVSEDALEWYWYTAAMFIHESENSTEHGEQA